MEVEARYNQPLYRSQVHDMSGGVAIVNKESKDGCLRKTYKRGKTGVLSSVYSTSSQKLIPAVTTDNASNDGVMIREI